MFTHILSDGTQPDTGEIVDGESRVLWILHWEHPRATSLYLLILEPLRNALQTHTLHHLVQHDFDENTAT